MYSSYDDDSTGRIRGSVNESTVSSALARNAKMKRTKTRSAAWDGGGGRGVRKRLEEGGAPGRRRRRRRRRTWAVIIQRGKTIISGCAFTAFVASFTTVTQITILRREMQITMM